MVKRSSGGGGLEEHADARRCGAANQQQTHNDSRRAIALHDDPLGREHECRVIRDRVRVMVTSGELSWLTIRG
jgi:hypothetical protein